MEVKQMNKLKMQSENLVEENIEFIAQKFPNCITETIKGYKKDGKVYGAFVEGAEPILEKAVNFDLLKQELSNVVLDGDQERYVMTWPDKKQAILTANAPIAKTLRPCEEESVDKNGTKGKILDEKTGKEIKNPNSKFDSENLYIEGDNLDVLKLLRETYLRKVKMIYIDPPYNTGNDFVYNDDFATDTEDYLQRSNQVDEQGNRMVTNNDSNGRFHTDWLNMIYPRLKVAKDLLTDDGVIFISIDDNEQDNLKKVCNEIFGESNFIGIHIRKTVTQRAMAKNYNTQHEYCLIYSRNKYEFNLIGDEKDLSIYNNPDNDLNGAWKSTDPTMSGSKNNFPIINPYNGKTDLPPKGRGWGFNVNKMNELIKNGTLIFKENYKENERGFILKSYKKNLKSNNLLLNSLDLCDNKYLNQVSTKEMLDLFDERMFDYAKPISFIKKIISYSKNKNDIILDFFSGSATTAHAVMQLNAEDGGNRKFIMVQLPELTSEDSEAYKAGYKNICEIGKERIRRAGQLIKMQITGDKFANDQNNLIKKAKSIKNTSIEAIKEFENSDEYKKLEKNEWENFETDIGFRDLKLDSSCMKEVYYNPSEVSQNLLTTLESNIKEDRTTEDLLFQVMLDMGVTLSSKIEERKLKIENAKCKIINNTEFETLNENEKKNIKIIYIVGEYNAELNEQPNLICCFDKNLTNEVVTEIAKMKPLYAVFRDSSMATDSVAVNFDQIFETYSPTTIRKVI